MNFDKALAKADKPGVLPVTVIAFGVLCWYAWPYPAKEVPAEPVIIHGASDEDGYSKGMAKSMDKLIDRAEKEAALHHAQVKATAEVFGLGLPTQQALNEWRDVKGWKP